MKGLIGVHHVSVSVPDIDRARQFYIDLLGAEEVQYVEWSEGNPFINDIVGLPECSGKSFMARLANTYIEVFEYLTPRSPPQDPRRPVNLNGYTHFALQVEDIEAVYQRMLAAGVTFHVPPQHLGELREKDGRRVGFRSTYGRDFFGNVFELMEIGDGSPVKPL